MKKVYLLVSGLLLSAAAVNAQTTNERAFMPIQEDNSSTRVVGLAGDRAPGDIIVSDDFSDFSNWSVYTGGSTTPEWELVSTTPGDLVTYMDVFASPTNANGFAAFNGVQYLLGGTVSPTDAYLEYVPVIDCSGVGAVTLQFFAAYRAFNQDDFFVEVSNDGGTTWGAPYQLFADMPTNDPTRQETLLRDITLDVASSATVKIRFHFQELAADPAFGSGYGAMVDDFLVKEAWDYDQEITASYHRSGLGISFENGLEYHQIPTNQITEINFAGEVQNLGGLVQVGSKLNVEVTGAGTYSGTSTPVDLAVSGSDSVSTTTTFTPSAMGDYDVTYFFDGDNAEEETINDTMYNSFSVGTHVYARDNGIGGSSIGNVTSNLGAPLLIGNVFDIFNDDVIGAVELVVTTDATNVGQLIFAQVMIFDEGAGAYVYADQTGDHEITAGENGGIITLYFEDDVVVSAGQTILVLAGHYGGSDEVRFRLAQGVDEQTVLGYTSGASDPFFLTAPSCVIVRPHMRSYASVDDYVSNNFSIGQNIPNPVADNAVINYELNEAANVSVEFVDVSGKIVKSINNGSQEAGAYTINIDANEFAEGVYFYTFTVGNEQVTKRMVITK